MRNVILIYILFSVSVGIAGQNLFSEKGNKTCLNDKRKPNILFIMTDEMRWDYLGVAGHPAIKTPNLDKLANSGYYFPRAYSPHPVCVPARVTLFTSRYGSVTGVRGNGNNTNQGEIFLPSILQHFGYSTGISGKLHFHPRGHAYGFDEFYSYTGEGEVVENTYLHYLKKQFGSISKYPTAEGTKPFPDDPLGADLGLFRHSTEHYESHWITRHAVDFLRRQSDEKPWFLFLSYNRPHSPSVLPEPYFSMYRDANIEVPELPGRFTRKDAELLGARERHIVEDPEMAEKMIKSYMGAITLVDDRVGEVLDLLEKRGWRDNTIIVFTADHGNLLGDQGRWFKGPMWEGSSRIPLIICVPETLQEKAGNPRKIDEIVELTDIMPTLLDLAGLKNKVEGMQGESLKHLIEERKEGWRNYAFGSLGNQLMIVEGDYKYVHYKNKPGLPEWEVFNLKEDPKEKVNLAEREGVREMLPPILERMQKIEAEQPLPMNVEGMALPEYASYQRPSKADDNVINEFGKTGRNVNVY